MKTKDAISTPTINKPGMANSPSGSEDPINREQRGQTPIGSPSLETMNTCMSRRYFLDQTARFCCQAGVAAMFFGGLAGAVSIAKGADRNGGGRGRNGTRLLEKDFVPGYVKLHQSGELGERADALWEMMNRCRLCPRECGANRIRGQTGFCNSPGVQLFISASMPHFGEERPLVGRGGSGTIFLTHCSLRCVFCQNFEISHLGRGNERTVDDMADMMLQLQRTGCHNINFVTPTHYSAFILKALDKAAEAGLRIPTVYNTCGWERLEILSLLDGAIDIYLPDFKFWDGDISAKLTAATYDYPEITREAVLEMHRQVGVAKPNENGIMQRGLMVRHLVMPNEMGGSVEILDWIAEHLPKETYINLMAQYNPQHRAFDVPKISRRLNRDEFSKVVDHAEDLGLTNLDIQGHGWLRR